MNVFTINRILEEDLKKSFDDADKKRLLVQKDWVFAKNNVLLLYKEYWTILVQLNTILGCEGYKSYKIKSSI